MRSKRIFLMALCLVVVGPGAGAALAYGGVSTGAAFLAASAMNGAGILARISSSLTEPIGLVLMGVCLIGLSVLLRKRSSRKRSH